MRIYRHQYRTDRRRTRLREKRAFPDIVAPRCIYGSSRSFPKQLNVDRRVLQSKGRDVVGVSTDARSCELSESSCRRTVALYGTCCRACEFRILFECWKLSILDLEVRKIFGVGWYLTEIIIPLESKIIPDSISSC